MLRRIIVVGLVAACAVMLAVVFAVVFQGWEAPTASGQYVALGSSFAAGAGLGPRAPGSPFICMRSTNGYPQRLARMTGLRLVDMTCSGSTTIHILHGGQAFLGPQLAAVGGNTELVTITSGGNDVNYIADLTRAAGKTGPIGKIFWTQPKPAEQRDFDRVAANFVSIVTEIRYRAPKAKVVLVSYPVIAPPAGSCDALGIDQKAAQRARSVSAELLEATRIAAKHSGAIFVDMDAASRGHDACSGTPWVNGANPSAGFSFHPNTAGAHATAKMIFAAISAAPPK